eukprot:scaffold1838_cov103-Cylindrotheca_fusiformis.AAC.3
MTFQGEEYYHEGEYLIDDYEYENNKSDHLNYSSSELRKSDASLSSIPGAPRSNSLRSPRSPMRSSHRESQEVRKTTVFSSVDRLLDDDDNNEDYQQQLQRETTKPKKFKKKKSSPQDQRRSANKSKSSPKRPSDTNNSSTTTTPNRRAAPSRSGSSSSLGNLLRALPNFSAPEAENEEDQVESRSTSWLSTAGRSRDSKQSRRSHKSSSNNKSPKRVSKSRPTKDRLTSPPSATKSRRKKEVDLKRGGGGGGVGGRSPIRSPSANGQSWGDRLRGLPTVSPSTSTLDGDWEDGNTGESNVSSRRSSISSRSTTRHPSPINNGKSWGDMLRGLPDAEEGTLDLNDESSSPNRLNNNNNSNGHNSTRSWSDMLRFLPDDSASVNDDGSEGLNDAASVVSMKSAATTNTTTSKAARRSSLSSRRQPLPSRSKSMDPKQHQHGKMKRRNSHLSTVANLLRGAATEDAMSAYSSTDGPARHDSESEDDYEDDDENNPHVVQNHSRGGGEEGGGGRHKRRGSMLSRGLQVLEGLYDDCAY